MTRAKHFNFIGGKAMLTDQEVRKPMPRLESLDAFFEDLGGGYFIHGFLYLIYIQPGRLDWTVKNFIRQSSEHGELSRCFELLCTDRGPDAERPGGIQYPTIKGKDGSIYSFPWVTYKDGTFYLQTYLCIAGAAPLALGEFTVLTLRKMIGMRVREHWFVRLWRFLNKAR